MKRKRRFTTQAVIGNLLLVLSCLFMAAVASAADRTVYYHTDFQGSVVAATDESGALLWRESYRPFGERIDREVSTKENTPFYTGKPHDDDTGLSYFGARDYDPIVGRFLGVDPVGVDPANLHSFNRYAYVNNNPYRYVDPDGREPHRWADGNYSDNDGQENPGRWVQVKGAYGQVGGGIAEGWMYHPVVIAGAGNALTGLGVLFKQSVSEFQKKLALRGLRNLTPQQQKAIRSLEKQIVKHEKKLQDFISKPTVRPGMENLSKEVIRKQQKRRVRHLKNEIETFKNNINKIKRGEKDS